MAGCCAVCGWAAPRGGQLGGSGGLGLQLSALPPSARSGVGLGSAPLLQACWTYGLCCGPFSAAAEQQSRAVFVWVGPLWARVCSRLVLVNSLLPLAASLRGVAPAFSWALGDGPSGGTVLWRLLAPSRRPGVSCTCMASVSLHAQGRGLPPACKALSLVAYLAWQSSSAAQGHPGAASNCWQRGQPRPRG